MLETWMVEESLFQVQHAIKSKVVSACASTWQMALRLFGEATGFRIRLNKAVGVVKGFTIS